MADWFVDQTIAGGNGTDPASAFPSITSVTWSAGDRAWVRKTHYELLSSSVFFGAASFYVATNFSKVHQIIGWPSSGDPFYGDRPPRGTTVGWDSDVCSMAVNSLMGLNMPTFANSTNSGLSGMLMAFGLSAYNICIQNNGGQQSDPFPNYSSVHPYYGHFDNVALLTSSGNPSSQMFSQGRSSWGKVTVVLSTTGAYALGNNFMQWAVRHLVISSKSIISGGLFAGFQSASQVQKIGCVQIDTSSCMYLINYNLTGNTGADDYGDGINKIGRVCGTRPYSGISSLGASGYWGWQIDDYFGEGPKLGGPLGPPMTRVASINEAAVDIGSGAVNALMYSCFSFNAGNCLYFVPYQDTPKMRAYFDVTSGTPIEIRVPIYVDSTAIYSLFNGGLISAFQCHGGGSCVATGSTCLVGSPTKWTGSLIAGGSAYLWSSKWTPTETASAVPFDVFIRPPTQATSGQGLTFNLFLGQPYHV